MIGHTKGFAIGQSPHNINDKKRVPKFDVDDLAGGGGCVKPFAPFSHWFIHEAFHLQNRSVGEDVIQLPSTFLPSNLSLI